MSHIIFYSEQFGEWFKHNDFFIKGQLVENYNHDLNQLIDTYLSDGGRSEIKSFTLPISISGNFFDFSGLIFAHHIRLTRDIKCCDTIIVIYGVLELEQLLRITPLAQIIITENIFYVNIAKYSFDDIRKSLENYSIKKFNINRFLDQININHPLNYDSHHSTDNEFALIQWSRYINCYKKIPSQFLKEFNSNLYFKYLRAKNPPLETIAYQDSFSKTIKAKILLVDDEAKKGWEVFFKSFFNNSEIEFRDSGIDFKNIDKDEIISKVKSVIEDFEPDIVLLDLRLHDSDFVNNITNDELTGLKILDIIKNINKGIQVIIITASNKAWNFDIAKQKGAFDFIIKDGYQETNISVNKLKSVIEIGSQRAQFLKKVSNLITKIKSLIPKNSHFQENNSDNNQNNLINRLKINLDIAFELLDLSYKILYKDKYLAYSYLQLFICIEAFANLDSGEKLNPILYEEIYQIFLKFDENRSICICQKRKVKRGDKIENRWFTKLKFNSKYELNDKENEYNRKFDTNFFVSAILIYKYGKENSSVKKWTDIYKKRNDVAHKGNIPKEEEIFELLVFIIYFFDNDNKNENNLDKALKPISFEVSLEPLKNKFNNK